MNSPAEDIKDLLVGETSLGLTFQTNLFVAKEPATPKNTTTIFDGVSGSPQLTFTKGENYFYDAVQIRIRNTSYQAGYDIADKIRVFLHGQGQVVINGTFYSVIYCSSGPVMLGWDENGRCIFIINFETQRR